MEPSSVVYTLDRMHDVVKQASVMLEMLSHRYYAFGSHCVPGVTEVLHGVQILDDTYYKDEHSERGTAVHARAQGMIDDGLSIEAWGAYRLYGESLSTWLRQYPSSRTLATELRVYHPELQYAGTLDWLVEWQGQLWIVDFKSGGEAPWHRLQTEAYAQAIRDVCQMKVRRGALYLQADGSMAQFRPHNRPSDRTFWLSALNCYRFKTGRV